MSRSNLSVMLGLGVLLVCGASSAWAQDIGPSEKMWDGPKSAAVAESRMLELSVTSVNDPASAELLFKEGNTIVSILDGLKDKGFPIEYKAKEFPATMTLVSLPTSERIDEVLEQILDPYDFRAYHSPAGQWIVKPKKKGSKASDPQKSEH